MLVTTEPQVVPPGGLGFEPGRFDAKRCERIAKVTRRIIRFRTTDWSHPLSYATRDYSGAYTDTERVPILVRRLVSELDEDMPERSGDISVLRLRLILPTDLMREHLDDANDLRKLVVLGGDGAFHHRPTMTSSAKVADVTPLASGDVVTLNNDTERRNRLLHRGVANSWLMLLIYGRFQN